MDEETIRNLAKEAVLVFLSEWEDMSHAQAVEREGAHFLIFRLPNPLHYASLHLNLEERCEELLTDLYKKLETREPESVDGNANIIMRFTFRLPNELTYMATCVPSFLGYSLFVLNLLAYRERVQSLSNLLDQNVQAYVAGLAGTLTHGLLQGYNLTEKKKRGASSVIDEGRVLEVFLRFRGEMPSIRQLAKELKTEPATIRAWLRKKGFKSLKDVADNMVSSYINMEYSRLKKKVTERKQGG